jgi:acyl dehydratase
MAGLYLEQFELDQVFRHEIRRTVTEADNMWFCNATYNPAQIHIDAEYCRNTEFGKPLVNSIFTLGLVLGLSIQDTTLGTTVANLGMTDTRFPKPVFAGDTLRSQTTVVEIRESKSRPNAGIVTFRHEGYNQNDELVCTTLRQALMLRRPVSVAPPVEAAA